MVTEPVYLRGPRDALMCVKEASSFRSFDGGIIAGPRTPCRNRADRPLGGAGRRSRGPRPPAAASRLVLRLAARPAGPGADPARAVRARSRGRRRVPQLRAAGSAGGHPPCAGVRLPTAGAGDPPRAAAPRPGEVRPPPRRQGSGAGLRRRAGRSTPACASRSPSPRAPKSASRPAGSPPRRSSRPLPTAVRWPAFAARF